MIVLEFLKWPMIVIIYLAGIWFLKWYFVDDISGDQGANEGPIVGSWTHAPRFSIVGLIIYALFTIGFSYAVMHQLPSDAQTDLPPEAELQ